MKLVKHEWPPHPNDYFYKTYTPKTKLDFAIDMFLKRVGRLPESVLLPEHRWRCETQHAGPESLYFLYRNIKICWHPESLLLLRVGPTGKREKA